jgi:hypothetical protein
MAKDAGDALVRLDQVAMAEALHAFAEEIKALPVEQAATVLPELRERLRRVAELLKHAR